MPVKKEKKVSFLEKNGSTFVIPERERRKLEERNKIPQEQLQNEALQAQQRQLEVKREQITPQQVDLATRQTQELEDLQKQTIPQETKPLNVRQAEAGAAVLDIAPITKLGEAAGLERASPEQIAQDKIGRAITRPIGIIATTSIKGISIGRVFSGFGRDVSTLQKESSDLIQSSKAVADNVALGTDPNLALQDMNNIEMGIRARYQQASISARKSPQDIVDNFDAQVQMAQDLQVVVLRRQALERYLLTGDSASYALTIGQLNSVPQDLNNSQE